MKNHGPSVYFDTSSKNASGKKRHNMWRADITVNEKRYRKRGSSREELKRWIENMKDHNVKEAL
jgi:arsenate reductase-like glutaredoxin family protein